MGFKWWHAALAAAGAIVAWELVWGAWAIREVHQKYRDAEAAAAASGKPLLVVGRPDTGMTALYGGGGCGDVCADLAGCPTCPVSVQTNVEDLSEFEDKQFGAVFVSHLLEHVCYPKKAVAELHRVADEVFIAYPRAWTLNAVVHPTHSHWMVEEKRGWKFIPIPGRACNIAREAA